MQCFITAILMDPSIHVMQTRQVIRDLFFTEGARGTDAVDAACPSSRAWLEASSG